MSKVELPRIQVSEVHSSLTSFYIKLLGSYPFSTKFISDHNQKFKIKRALEEASLKHPLKNVIIDYITEPHVFVTEQHLENGKALSWYEFLHDLCNRLNFNPSQLILLTSNVYGKESYDAWCLSKNITHKLDIRSQHKAYWLSRLFSAGYTIERNEIEDKHFTMFVGRPRLHKDIIVQWYLKNISNSNKEQNMLSTFIYGSKFNFDGWDNYLIEKVKLLPGTIENNSSVHPSLALPWGGDPKLFTKAFARGLINFVIDYLECEDFDSIQAYLNFKNTNAWWLEDMISEKTFKCIVLKKPFIRLGMPHSLKKLREWGFKTFDGVLFDESYDSDEDFYTRTDKILTQVEHYLNMPFDKIKEKVYSSEVQEIVNHNYNLACELYKNKEELVNV